MNDNPMFDEIGVDGKKGTYKFGDWKQYAVHSPTEIKGFFGPARWLSNFHLCLVSFDGAFYPSAENAYQSAKVIPEDRDGFQTCTPAESKSLWKDPKLTRIYTAEEWDTVKYDIIERNLCQLSSRHKLSSCTSIAIDGEGVGVFHTRVRHSHSVREIIEDNWVFASCICLV